MQPFNLERFKAGEPAYHKDTLKEFFYFGDRPGGRIAVKYLNHDVWVCYSTTIQILNDVYYMKEKKLTIDGNTVLATVPYQCCPVCNGVGKTLANGFTSSVYEICKVCNGGMIIPMHIVDWRFAVKE